MPDAVGDEVPDARGFDRLQMRPPNGFIMDVNCGSPSDTPDPLHAPSTSATSSTGPQVDMSALAAKRGKLSVSQPTRPAPVIVTPGTPSIPKVVPPPGPTNASRNSPAKV